MYKDFFGLHSDPFQLSPDPLFMVSSDRSNDALTSISAAVGQRKGFVVMTGEVGTGKTLVLRCLFDLWDREQIPFAYFIGPRLSTIDFLSYINCELGIQVREPTKGNLLRGLYAFFLSQFEKGLTTVLIIDEAHEMPRSVLEEVRLLTNFETAQQKLVQIVLVGQPELDKKLDSPELRSLKQRIAVRCRLEPLRPEEIRNYIERRLEKAGADPDLSSSLFPVETVKAIYRYSTGLPRLINNICDQAMAAACTSQIRSVPAQVIDEIAARFRLEPVRDRTEPAHSTEPSGPVAASTTEANKARPAAAAAGADTVLLYLDLDQNAPAQAGIPAGARTANKAPGNEPSSAKGTPLEIERVDQDDFRNALNEISVPSWARVAKETRDGADTTMAAATGEALGTSAVLSTPQSSVAELTEPDTQEMRPEAVTEIPLIAADPVVSRPVATQRVIVSPASEPATATPFESKLASKKSAAPREEDTALVVAAATPGKLAARVASAEAHEGELAEHRTKKTYHALKLSAQDKQRILIGAVLLGILLLGGGGTWYLRRANRAAAANSASVTSAAAPNFAGADQPLAASATQSTGGTTGSAAAAPTGKASVNSDLTAFRQLGQPSTASKRIAFGAMRLSKPRARQKGKATDANDPGAALQMDSKMTVIADGLATGLVEGKPGTSFPVPPMVGGEVKPARLIRSKPPVYPPLAKTQRISGDVRLDALVDVQGYITNTEVVSGPMLLQESAKAALREWKYEPAMLDGKPVPMHLLVTIQLRLE